MSKVLPRRNENILNQRISKRRKLSTGMCKQLIFLATPISCRTHNVQVLLVDAAGSGHTWPSYTVVWLLRQLECAGAGWFQAADRREAIQGRVGEGWQLGADDVQVLHEHLPVTRAVGHPLQQYVAALPGTVLELQVMALHQSLTDCCLQSEHTKITVNNSLAKPVASVIYILIYINTLSAAFFFNHSATLKEPTNQEPYLTR